MCTHANEHTFATCTVWCWWSYVVVIHVVVCVCVCVGVGVLRCNLHIYVIVSAAMQACVVWCVCIFDGLLAHAIVRLAHRLDLVYPHHLSEKSFLMFFVRCNQ